MIIISSTQLILLCYVLIITVRTAYRIDYAIHVFERNCMIIYLMHFLCITQHIHFKKPIKNDVANLIYV